MFLSFFNVTHFLLLYHLRNILNEPQRNNSINAIKNNFNNDGNQNLAKTKKTKSILLNNFTSLSSPTLPCPAMALVPASKPLVPDTSVPQSTQLDFHAPQL